jgi:hypothetical protein
MKNWELNKIGLAAASVALFLAILAAVLVLTLPSQRGDRYNMAFPDTAGGSNHHEWRVLSPEDNMDSRVRLIVEELLLGPMELGAIPFFPGGTEIRSIVVNDGNRTVYIDFSSEIIVHDQSENIGFEEVMDLLEYNLFRNFPRLEQIIVTVEGQLPGVPRFTGL